MFLDKWFSRLKKIQNSWIEILSQLYVTEAKSGIPVNWKTALQCATALACSHVISNGLSQVPFRLFRKTGRERLPATDHPLYDLFEVGPNNWQTGVEFRKTMGMHLIFFNQAFFAINRYRGEIAELLPFEPQRVTVVRDNWKLSYETYLDNGTKQEIPAANMWHVRGVSWNTWSGLDGVYLAREALGLAMATEEHGARIFSNGARPGGILSTDSSPGPEKIKEMKKYYDENYAGNENAFKTLILWGGMKWAPMASPNDEAQFLETRKFQVEEVCRAFNVNPIMVFYSDKIATYASAEQMFIAHVVHCLSPWYSLIESSANKYLLTPKERKAGYYFKFIANGLMRGSAKDRAEFYKTMFMIHTLNPNEIREFEEMNPWEGGDSYNLPLASNSISSNTPNATETTNDAQNT